MDISDLGVSTQDLERYPALSNKMAAIIRKHISTDPTDPSALVYKLSELVGEESRKQVQKLLPFIALFSDIIKRHLPVTIRMSGSVTIPLTPYLIQVQTFPSSLEMDKYRHPQTYFQAIPQSYKHIQHTSKALDYTFPEDGWVVCPRGFTNKKNPLLLPPMAVQVAIIHYLEYYSGITKYYPKEDLTPHAP